VPRGGYGAKDGLLCRWFLPSAGESDEEDEDAAVDEEGAEDPITAVEEGAGLGAEAQLGHEPILEVGIAEAHDESEADAKDREAGGGLEGHGSGVERLGAFEAGEGPVAARNLAASHPEPVEYRREQASDGFVVCRIEGEVLSVSESATGEQEGPVLVAVAVGISHARAVDHRGVVEELLSAFLGFPEPIEELEQHAELGLFDASQFGDHLGSVAVMGEGMRLGLDAFHLTEDSEWLEEDSDDPG